LRYVVGALLAGAFMASHNLRQLGDGCRYPPCFLTAEEFHDRPPSRVVFVVDVGQFLAASRLDDKAAREILHQPRWPKMPLPGRGIIVCARCVTADNKCQKIGCFHLTMKAEMLARTIVAAKRNKQRFPFHIGFNPT